MTFIGRNVKIDGDFYKVITTIPMHSSGFPAAFICMPNHDEQIVIKKSDVWEFWKKDLRLGWERWEMWELEMERTCQYCCFWYPATEEGGYSRGACKLSYNNTWKDYKPRFYVECDEVVDSHIKFRRRMKERMKTMTYNQWRNNVLRSMAKERMKTLKEK
jgi:hypothetical protein